MATTARQPDTLGQLLTACVSKSRSRLEFWTEFIRAAGTLRMAEIGVYRGDFAANLLRECESLTDYYMIDPWRHLSDWNKPANGDDSALEGYFRETEAKTEFAAGRRHILRGMTTEVMDSIPDGELDFVYIDGDHTLKGIAIDMICAYAKVRPGGFLGGDDFSASIWQHDPTFEPTLVFPFAVYFAEAVGAAIYALPWSQFCLQKGTERQFSFIDLTGKYDDRSLRSQFASGNLLKGPMAARFPLLVRALRKSKSIFRG